MAPSWQEMERRLATYEVRWPMVPLIAVGGSLGVIGLMALTHVVALLVALPVPAVIAMAYDARIQPRCPACGRGFPKRRAGEPPAEILLLRNLRQCPHCQVKFDGGR